MDLFPGLLVSAGSFTATFYGIHRLSRLRRRSLDPPPPVPWDQLDEPTAEWIRANLQLAGVAQPTASPDVEDLGPANAYTVYKTPNPLLVGKIIENQSATLEELNALSLADYAYVRPFLLRGMHHDADCQCPQCMPDAMAMTFNDWDPNDA